MAREPAEPCPRSSSITAGRARGALDGRIGCIAGAMAPSHPPAVVRRRSITSTGYSAAISGSEISKNWAGRPLRDYETVVNYISTTATKTGLHVDAHLVRAEYATGVKISDKEMKDLSIRHHDIQPNRNYTISPR